MRHCLAPPRIASLPRGQRSPRRSSEIHHQVPRKWGCFPSYREPRTQRNSAELTRCSLNFLEQFLRHYHFVQISLAPIQEHVEFCLELVRSIFWEQVSTYFLVNLNLLIITSVISYYLPLLLTNVGVTDTNTVLLLNAIYALTGWIAAATGARFHDIIGRRKMMLGSTLGMIICLTITAGTAAGYVNTGSTSSSKASIAFIYIFGVTFAFAYTSMQPIYPAEVMSNEMRAKGMFLFQITAGLASFVNTFAAPVALKNIGYWFYVFFVFWDCFEFLFIYFFFVETKGRTLEELDEVFEAKNPRKASTMKVRVRKQETVDRHGVHNVSITESSIQPRSSAD